MTIPSIRNRDLIRSTLLRLERSPSFSEEHVNLLTQPQYCKEQFRFRTGTAVLKALPEGPVGQSVKELCYDAKGRSRYYVEPIYLCGKPYLISNYWYKTDRKHVKDNITHFLEWADRFAR